MGGEIRMQNKINKLNAYMLAIWDAIGTTVTGAISKDVTTLTFGLWAL